MSAKNILVAMGLLTLSMTSMAADIESVTVKGSSGVTRAEVKAELQRAFANGEIVHGDLVVLHELLSPKQERPAQRVAQQPAPERGAPRVAGK